MHNKSCCLQPEYLGIALMHSLFQQRFVVPIPNPCRLSRSYRYRSANCHRHRLRSIQKIDDPQQPVASARDRSMAALFVAEHSKIQDWRQRPPTRWRIDNSVDPLSVDCNYYLSAGPNSLQNISGHRRPESSSPLYLPSPESETELQIRPPKLWPK